jgi:hypothetical protein
MNNEGVGRHLVATKYDWERADRLRNSLSNYGISIYGWSENLPYNSTNTTSIYYAVFDITRITLTPYMRLLGNGSEIIQLNTFVFNGFPCDLIESIVFILIEQMASSWKCHNLLYW